MDIFQMCNAGAVLRSCEIFPLQEVHFVEGRYGKGSDLKMAMGAHKWIDINPYGTMNGCVGRLRKMEYRIIDATPDNTSCALDQSIQETKTTLLFGTEKEGLSPETVLLAHSFLNNPDDRLYRKAECFR